MKKISAAVRSWRPHTRTGHAFADLAQRINPIVRGWMYYRAFHRSALYQVLSRINAYLVRWIRKKYRRLRAEKKAIECWQGITACSRTGNGSIRLVCLVTRMTRAR